MPAKFKRAVKHMLDKGMPKSEAYATATKLNIGNVKQVRKAEAKKSKKRS